MRTVFHQDPQNRFHVGRHAATVQREYHQVSLLVSDFLSGSTRVSVPFIGEDYHHTSLVKCTFGPELGRFAQVLPHGFPRVEQLDAFLSILAFPTTQEDQAGSLLATSLSLLHNMSTGATSRNSRPRDYILHISTQTCCQKNTHLTKSRPTTSQALACRDLHNSALEIMTVHSPFLAAARNSGDILQLSGAVVAPCMSQ